MARDAKARDGCRKTVTWARPRSRTGEAQADRSIHHIATPTFGRPSNHWPMASVSGQQRNGTSTHSPVTQLPAPRPKNCYALSKHVANGTRDARKPIRGRSGWTQLYSRHAENATDRYSSGVRRVRSWRYSSMRRTQRTLTAQAAQQARPEGAGRELPGTTRSLATGARCLLFSRRRCENWSVRGAARVSNAFGRMQTAGLPMATSAMAMYIQYFSRNDFSLGGSTGLPSAVTGGGTRSCGL